MLSKFVSRRFFASSRQLVNVQETKDRLVKVTWNDGRVSTFPLIWLRDTSPDPSTYTQTPAMTARNLTMNTFDVEQTAQKIWLDSESDTLNIQWTSQELISTYPSAWLRLRDPSNAESRAARRRVYLAPGETWGAEKLGSLQRFEHGGFLRDDRIAHDFLAAVCRDGIAVLSGAKKGRRGAVEAIGERIGMIKRTHFGTVFEVATKSDASNMAYASNGSLPFHTDFPSLANPPQLQLLHMLQRAETGGNSLFVDGFHVAQQLRAEKPDVFEVLTKYSMEYIERGYDVHEGQNGIAEQRFDYDMCARHKVIRLNELGEVCEIQFGNAMRSWFYDCEPDKIQEIYRAMKIFTEYCYQERNVLKFALDDGDTVLWANKRLLHTRDAFRNAPGKSRTLTGCYFDWDILKSRIRHLRNSLNHPEKQVAA
ncbi:unnamed protein product [Caenorhabditis angaria]|uniref:gamma-butyrobetaine dioxygenase n=1 Tax=Caenorhabditis angaria TaxID=860376 RepID=A0A9P1MX90_9PELO|nr:unnamed protein product [Caenorhabditis angaria]